MLRNILIVLAFLKLIQPVCGQNEADGLVKWLSFKEAQEKNKQVPKPLLVDIYTDWCGWCKHMMKTTYSNAALAGYINANFYPVKFNAEGKDTIEYNGKIYKPLSPEPKTPHELTLKFLGEKLSYPSTIFITNNFEYNLLTQGFLDDKKIEPILVFMVENGWRSAVFDEFNKHFQHTFYDTVYKKVPVKMYSFKELQTVQAKKPRKVLVNIGTGFCNTCRVMTKTTFVDSSIAGYLNKNFYVVNFDAETADTIKFKNEKYYKTLVNGYPFNSLAAKITNGRFSLPALCILDEQLSTLEVLNFYQSPEQIKPILEYFGSNSFKTEAWTDFMKEYSTGKKARPKK
jgi:thioredoxin-related protein